MPRTPHAPPTVAPRRGHPRAAIAVIAVGLVLIGLAMWVAHRTWRQHTAEGIAAGLVSNLGKDLPQAYGNGLVLERIVLEGKDIVMVIRSTRLSLAVAARDPVSFAEARSAEKALLLQFCDKRDVRLVLGQGLTVTRRFLDLEDRLFFEVTLAAQDCAGTL